MNKKKMTEEQLKKEKIQEDKVLIEEFLYGKSGYHRTHMQKTLPSIVGGTVLFLLLALIINYLNADFFPSIKSALITISVLGFTQYLLEDFYMVSLFLGDGGLLTWLFPALVYAFFRRFYMDVDTSIFISALITIIVMRSFIDSCKETAIREKISELHSLGIEVILPSKEIRYRELPKE